MIAFGLAILTIVFGLAGIAGIIARNDKAWMTGISGMLFFLVLLAFEMAA